MNARSVSIMSLFLQQKIRDLDQQILEYSKVAQYLQNELTTNRASEQVGKKIATNIAITSNAAKIIAEVADLAEEKQLLFETKNIPQLELSDEDNPIERSDIGYEEFQVALDQLVLALEQEEMYEACQLMLKYRNRIDQIRSEMRYAASSCLLF